MESLRRKFKREGIGSTTNSERLNISEAKESSKQIKLISLPQDHLTLCLITELCKSLRSLRIAIKRALTSIELTLINTEIMAIKQPLLPKIREIDMQETNTI